MAHYAYDHSSTTYTTISLNTPFSHRSICFTARLESCERFLIQSIEGCERQGEVLGCGQSIGLLRLLQFRAFLGGENGHVSYKPVTWDGCKPLTCDHLYGAKYGTEGTLLHVVRPQWHPCPRCAPTMAVHVVRPQWLSTLCAHNGILLHVVCPQWHPCPRCAPTMAVHVVCPQWLSTLCAHNGCPRCAPTMAVHVVRPQWHPCPRCAPTMASLSTLCASLAHSSL